MQRIDIGIDAGGTKTRLEARTSSGDRLFAEGKGSNPRVIGAEETTKVLSEMIREACGSHLEGADVRLCAGIAGASTSDLQNAISDGLEAVLASADARTIRIIDDATTSFEAAFAGEPGTLLLLGTGSNIVCKTFGGDWIYSGGWGYLVGDEGSGHAIGRLGLRAVARAMDRKRSTRLVVRAASDFGLVSRSTFLSAIYGGSLKFAEFGRVVLDEASTGDIECRLIVSEAVSMLIDDLAATVEAARADLPRIIRVIGGLSRSVVYMGELRAGIAVRLGEEWEIGPSERTPLEGALWIASKLAE